MYCRRKPVRHREIASFGRRMPRFDLAQIRHEILELSDFANGSRGRKSAPPFPLHDPAFNGAPFTNAKEREQSRMRSSIHIVRAP
jgi:hypothetical protein